MGPGTTAPPLATALIVVIVFRLMDSLGGAVGALLNKSSIPLWIKYDIISFKSKNGAKVAKLEKHFDILRTTLITTLKSIRENTIQQAAILIKKNFNPYQALALN